MPEFTNQATLSYNGTTVNSNTVTGELVQVLTATKSSLNTEYTRGDRITYLITLHNSGASPFTGVTITDNLGAHDVAGDSHYPLTYVPNTLGLFTNGVRQPAPTAQEGPPLIISGITIPANSNVLVLFEAVANNYAPLLNADTITNTATINASGLTTPIMVSHTIPVANHPQLAITKSLYPNQVTEHGQLTYTFEILNYGNTSATAADLVSVRDHFLPILDAIRVTYNNTPWTQDIHYTYSAASGIFESNPGLITVDAATFTQDTVTGQWSVIPGKSVLRIEGTVV